MQVWTQVALFVVLFAVAIPWYWGAVGLSPVGRTGGVPNWFLVAVLGSAAISAVTAWQLRRWGSDDDPPPSQEAR